MLRLAEERFDVFLTSDRNLVFQQNLAQLRISVIVLVAQDNRLESLRVLMPKVLEELESIQPGEVVQIG